MMSPDKISERRARALPWIFAVRGKKVVADAELAKLYRVPTKRLNEAVQRNAARFPLDFGFLITREELVNLKSQFAASSSRPADAATSQFGSGENRHGGNR